MAGRVNVPTLPSTPVDFGKVQNAYRSFWNAIVTLTDDKAQAVQPGAIVVERDPASPYVLAHNPRHALQFRGMSSRARQARESYDIYIQFWQRIAVSQIGDERSYAAVESTVRVQYLEARSDKDVRLEIAGNLDPSRVITGVHYDLCPIGELHHPIFHAQFDMGCIEAQSLGRRYALPTGVTKCGAPRIPSAPMDLPGVIYVILHDHLATKVAKGWPASVRATIEKLPQFPRSSATRLDRGAYLECPTWYLHAGHHT